MSNMNTQDKIKAVGQEVIDLLLEKNKNYGDSALKPANIFAKGDFRREPMLPYR